MSTILSPKQIPDRISGNAVQKVLVDPPGLYLLTRSYIDHLQAYEHSKSQVTASYFSLMAAIEIYLKIHLSVYLWLFWDTIKNLEGGTYIWQTILSHSKKPKEGGIEPKISLKNSFSHDLISLLITLKRFVPVDENEVNLLSKTLEVTAGKDWTEPRYMTMKLPSTDTLNSVFENFKKFKEHMVSHKLDVLDRIEV